MGLFAGLLSVVALSLFLAHFLRRSASLMPLLSIALAMVFFMLAGCAGLLAAAGWVWYAGCAAGLVYVVLRLRKKLLALVTPGLVLFFAAGAFFILLFWITQPMLTFWDEFTFWGTAGKVTSETHQLYTTAQSSLIARSYPPGLIVFTYMMQFFGGFTEPGFMAAFAIVPLAGFAAASAFWDKSRTACFLFFAAMLMLPLLFEQGGSPGRPALSYLVCMADAPMGVFFGGALCFYFEGGQKGARLWLPFGIVLAALVCIKDMGLALALVALFIAALDALCCERRRLGFYKLRRGPAWLAGTLCCLALVAGAYAVWALHLGAARGINRFDLGNEAGSLPMLNMLWNGAKALFGVGASAQFSAVLPMMLNAFFTRPVMLLGSGAVALCLIAAVLLAAFLLCPTKRQRRRVAVFAGGMALCFVAFYIFNIFTYSYIIQWPEAQVLKDYDRYISPFWVGWTMASLALLAGAATHPKASFARARVARAVSGAVSLGLVLPAAFLVNWGASFLHWSPSNYSQRLLLQGIANEARQQGMQRGDRVYTISQYDDGTRFYIYGFELDAVRVPLYLESVQTADGTRYRGTASATLAPPEKEALVEYEVPCTPEELTEYLRQTGCTHVFVDILDGYILEEFAPLFSDRLEGWADDFTSVGNRYYAVRWNADGSCTLVAPGGGAAA